MTQMRAAVYRGSIRLELEDLPRPEPGPGEMVIRVDVCGVCGTDVKKIDKGLVPPPRIFGHEIAGVVAALGAGVTNFHEGDRVVVHHHIPCLKCFYCERKLYAQCAIYKENGTTAGFEAAGGGFAEYLKAAPHIVERGAIPIPSRVKAEVACLVEPVNTCLKAIDQANVRDGETVLVVGQGPIGSILMQLARIRGAPGPGLRPFPVPARSGAVPGRRRLRRQRGRSRRVGALGNGRARRRCHAARGDRAGRFR